MLQSDTRRKDSARGCVVYAPRFRGIIFKRLIIRHSEIMLLHDNYIGAYVHTYARSGRASRALNVVSRPTHLDEYFPL